MEISKIINGALKQLGVLSAGENAQAGELADALDCLQQLLAQWANERLYIYKSNILILKLDGSGVFRIKPKSCNKNFCCDYEISECVACNSSDFTSEDCTCGLHNPKPKTHLHDDVQSIFDIAWLDGRQIELIRDLSNSKTRYASIFYKRDADEWVFDIQDKSAKELKIKVFTFPESFDCNDELAVPKHYERALRLTLALEIAPMFGVEPSMLLLKNQSNAIDLLKRSNSTPFYAVNDLPIGVHRNGHCY